MRCLLVDREGFVKEMEVPADEMKRVITIARSAPMKVSRESNYVENRAPAVVTGYVEVQFVLVARGMTVALYEER